MMKKDDLIKQFSNRLRDALIAAGYRSNRSTSGVDIHKLAGITGYSQQICRKYLLGQVIPEPAKLTEIASKLNVSPGWLLFGDSHSQDQCTENKITVSRNLLHYIFAHANSLYHHEQTEHEVPNFLTELVDAVSRIQTDEDQSKKIIDIALGSIKHFMPEKE
jgi:transcriptional regulator with XRE-family HTH domain